jgi:uncharacterized protein (DUF2164 family)
MVQKNIKKIELTKEEKRQIINAIKTYFEKERDEELGDLSAEIIMDFIAEKIGPYFYNQGVRDAQSYLSEKIEDLYGLEKPIR